MEQWSGLRHQSQSSGQIDRNNYFMARVIERLNTFLDREKTTNNENLRTLRLKREREDIAQRLKGRMREHQIKRRQQQKKQGEDKA